MNSTRTLLENPILIATGFKCNLQIKCIVLNHAHQVAQVDRYTTATFLFTICLLSFTSFILIAETAVLMSKKSLAKTNVWRACFQTKTANWNVKIEPEMNKKERSVLMFVNFMDWLICELCFNSLYTISLGNVFLDDKTREIIVVSLFCDAWVRHSSFQFNTFSHSEA